MPRSPRPWILALSLLSPLSSFGCAGPVEPPLVEPPELGAALHVDLLALRVHELGSVLPPSAEPSAALSSFVDGDEELARAVLDGLRDSAYMLARARCSSADAAASVELLARTEDYVLYAALFALLYELERREPTTGTQALAVLHRLRERMDSTDTLFPSRELLTPEEVAVTRGRRRAQEQPQSERPNLFAIYVEELFESSTSNRELALEKQRIAERIDALREAISTLYLRDRSERAQLCAAVDVLAEATQDAWLWASEAELEGRSESRPHGFAVELELALTNIGEVESLAVLPRAALSFEDATGQRHSVALEPAQLREAGLRDNHVAPGFTLTRVMVGAGPVAPALGCSLRLELTGGAGVEAVELSLAACSVEGHGD